MRFGKSIDVPHHEGHNNWQVQGREDLVVCWIPLLDEEDPVEYEKRLLKEFAKGYDRLPFANHRE